MRKPVVVAVLWLSLFANAAQAQRFGEAVEVTVVEVPVTVVDRAGNPVRGLTRESFEVYDDGKRAPIEYFEAVDLATITAAPGRPLPPVAYRNFLLLFDFANSRPGTIGRAQAAARDFVGANLTDRDLVGVASYTPTGGLRMITSFTNDRSLVRAAIDGMGESSQFRVSDPLLLATPPSVMAGGGGPAGQHSVIAQRNAGRDEAIREANENTDRFTKLANDAELAARLQAQIANFGGVARTLDSLRGQKQIILLSEGFDPRLVTGRQDLSFQKTQQQNDAVMSGEIWKVDSDERFGNAASANFVNQMAELFRRSDVKMHAIDIKGLRAEVDAREGVQRNSNEGLFMITQPTGGTVFKNANDLGQNFQDLLKRQSVVYLLGISAKGTGKPGKFHTLKVKTTAKGAEVSHRAGYHEGVGEKTPELAKTLSLAEILVTDAPVDDVTMKMFATAAPGTTAAARVPVVVDIDGPKLLAETNGSNVTANIFVYAFDEQHRVHDYMQQRVALDVAKVGDTLRKTGVRYVGALKLDPGKYAIKALVRVEETGRIGFMRTDLDVPAYAERTVLPPLAMGDVANWITLLSPTRGEDASSILSVGPQPFVPASRMSVDAGAPLRFALMVYRMSVADLGVAPVIVSSDGSTRDAAVSLVGRTQPDNAGVTKLVFDLKPDGLQKGDYDLRLTVTPKDQAASVVTLPFAVR
ncbi:MAG TPA: VWA domain-containing protein [Thermoanaerobaculia bacterium]|nr:VWA domain-containing protein [Thermoanaerobaculia bacterium]